MLQFITGAAPSEQSAKRQVSTLITLKRPQPAFEQRGKTEERESDEGLTSVNCRGQTPTFSPSLASIQCSSRRLTTVRTSPCTPQMSNTHTEVNLEGVEGKGEAQINHWRNKKKVQVQESVCTQLRSSEFVLGHVTSTPFVSAGPALFCGQPLL